MPVYEYRCRTCDSRFEARRAVADADGPLDCPAGHPETVRLLSVFATVSSSPSGQAAVPRPVSGGGCGAGCACAH